MTPSRARRSKSSSPGPLRAIGYVRVSTGQQADSGAGLDAQRIAVVAEAERRGWTLEIVTDAGLSGATMARPALADALARLDRGEADVLLASKIDRVSRSVADFAALLERARRNGWRLVVLDVATEGPAGEFAAHVVSAAAQYERSLASQRTREGLAARRAAGVRLGRPSVLPREVLARIIAERSGGASFRAIASGLTTDGIPTARGGTTWHPSAVRAALHSQDATQHSATGT